jgi:uncharacterized protein (PEP-CTERM system associated)
MASPRRSNAELFLRATSLVFVAGATAPAWSDIQFVPSVALSSIYVDNFGLTPPGAPKTGDLIGELDPSVQFRQQAPDLISALDYNLQALWFHDHASMDTTHSNGRANLSWTPTPVANLFSVDGWVSYIQQPIDPTQPTNEGNLFAVSNVANRLSAYLAPTLRNDFGGFSGLARYSEATSIYSGVTGSSATTFQNSRTGTATANLASNDIQGLFSWGFDGRHALTTFQSAQDFRDDRVAADAGLRVMPTLRLLATVGAETNILTSSTSGGLNSAFWAAGFEYAPSTHGSLEARFGHRFFGDAYSGRWTLNSRLLSMQILYIEEPTTDAESDSLTTFVPGEIQVDTQAYFGVLRAVNTYSPYIRKSLDATFSLTGLETQLSLRIYDLRRRYLQIPLQTNLPGQLQGTNDSTRGGELMLTRQVTPRDKLSLSARLAYADELDGFFYRDHRYALDYTHLLSQTLDAALQAVHLTRDGASQYSANIYRLTIRKSF